MRAVAKLRESKNFPVRHVLSLRIERTSELSVLETIAPGAYIVCSLSKFRSMRVSEITKLIHLAYVRPINFMALRAVRLVE